MNGTEVLRIVDAIHRDKGIEKEIVFEGIAQAIISAARKHFGEECEIVVDIDRETGEPHASVDGQELEADEIGDLLGRIAAQTAKQVMIQKIREAERDALFEEFSALKGHIVTGAISQLSGGTATVNLGKVEGILPRGEQIPGETHRVGERVRAVVMEVRKAGSRVKIILSRTHPEFVRRLFELEIPEVSEHVIEVRSLAREAGYRSKVAVSCYDSKIDAVGACVGVRGARVKSIKDELAGEHIDIVRWNDSLQVLVPNALQPAEVDQVILCPMLGKVIVLVADDQLSLAIGKKGQNVRLASKLVGWDINVMTQEQLDELLESAVTAFASVPDVSDELAENLVEQGFFTFDDLSVIEPDQLAELGGLTAEECDRIVAYADAEAARIEAEEIRAAQQAREDRERERIEAEAAAMAPPSATVAPEEATAEVAESAEVESATAESEAATAPEGSETGGEASASEEETSETAPASVEAAGESEQEAEQKQISDVQQAEVAETSPEGSGGPVEGAEPEAVADETVSALSATEQPEPTDDETQQSEPTTASAAEDSEPDEEPKQESETMAEEPAATDQPRIETPGNDEDQHRGESLKEAKASATDD